MNQSEPRRFGATLRTYVAYLRRIWLSVNDGLEMDGPQGRDPIDHLLNRARALPARPVAIEALWDGDSNGWYVTLCAIVGDGGGYRSLPLRVFNGGGDIRILNGAVPPWPEAQEANELGTRLAARFGVPFHFPSPARPEDDCPHWWERDRAIPCARCGIELLQADDVPWRGTCYPCHCAIQQERRAAAWTPEQRRAPKCEICGEPAAGQVENRHRCALCLEKYRDFHCATCGIPVCIQRTLSRGDLCSQCELAERVAALPVADTQSIRAAAARSEHAGMRAASKILKCSLPSARRVVAMLTKR